eukprot:c590_g1_i1 orf=322-657(-)
MGFPVPVPPQLLQVLFPVPPQDLHPTSPSDQRLQKHGTLLVPLQVGHRGNPPTMDFSSASSKDFTMKAPAITPIPEASCVNTMGGAIHSHKRHYKFPRFSPTVSCDSWLVR